MRLPRALFGSAVLLSLLAGCDSCSKGSDAPAADAAVAEGATAESRDARAFVVAETIPRCRLDGPRLTVPGEDVVVGEAAIAADALYVGVVRRDGKARLSSVVRVALDLGSLKTIDLGPAPADDPPPRPHVRGGAALVTSFARGKASDAGANSARRLEITRLEASGPVLEATIPQQSDESLAYDVAWPASGPGLVAWDEDAPRLPEQLLSDRGVIRVQSLGGGEAGASGRIVSPEKSDADAPQLVAKPGGGFVLGWLARKSEVNDDAGPTGAAEGPGERRAFRWVEIMMLDASGAPTSPVRRVSSDKGHIASFDLVATGSQVVVLAQDETARIEGAGERVLRFVVDGEKVEGADLVDGGVGHSLADLLALPDAGHFLTFLDVQEHAHLLGLGGGVAATSAPTVEPALDGVRVLGAAAPDILYAVGPSQAGQSELRRFSCR